MEIQEFTSAFYKIYNPVAGDTIIDDDCDDEAESLIAYWVTEVFEEPVMNDNTFAEAWNKYTSDYKNDNDGESPDYDALIKFLSEYENPEWKVLEITSYGMACGPITSTLCMVVKKDCVFEEIEDEEVEESDEDKE